MSKPQLPQVIFDGTQAKVSATVTATNGTDTLNATAHGLSNGDRVSFTNSGGGLPAGITAGVLYYVISAAADTFKISLTSGGSAVDITSDGTGTQTFYKDFVGAAVDVSAFDAVLLQVATASNFAGSLLVRGSMQETSPDWGARSSAANFWDNLALHDVNQATETTNVAGDTGQSGAVQGIFYRVNTAGLRWLNVISLNFSVGTFNVQANRYSVDSEC